MKRRAFIQLLGLTPLVAVFPSLAKGTVRRTEGRNQFFVLSDFVSEKDAKRNIPYDWHIEFFGFNNSVADYGIEYTETCVLDRTLDACERATYTRSLMRSGKVVFNMEDDCKIIQALLNYPIAKTQEEDDIARAFINIASSYRYATF